MHSRTQSKINVHSWYIILHLNMWIKKRQKPPPKFTHHTQKFCTHSMHCMRTWIFKHIYISVGGNPLSLLKATYSLTEQTQEDPDDPEPAGEGDIQIGYCDYLYSPSIGAVTKKIAYRNLGQNRYHLIKFSIIWHLCSPVWVRIMDFCSGYIVSNVSAATYSMVNMIEMSCVNL